ncbi:MAG: sensor histidine kinase KdpD [Thermomicrobiales bacterium]
MTTRDDNRPDPDELLRRYGTPNQRDGRGRLHIYLGAAPGVGKTYAMLLEGHRLRDAGVDVAVGLLETHGRPETAALLDGLEETPRLEIEYRGIRIPELDVDAILAQRPHVVLVDELAHTNAPGSDREKRWQDVELIRDAGIDVLTTLNIQHLESLNALVENITGVRVRETIPDHILDSASEIQLIDLPVSALIDRLKAGKIYPPPRATQALENFFREGNLTALRELALRQTAAGVDERLENYMREHDIEAVWAASQRVVALLTGDERERAVVRSAWRLAEGERAELLIAAIFPEGGIERESPDRQQAWRLLLDLAEDLGGRVEVIETTDRLTAVCDLLQRENASTLVMGYAPQRGWLGRMRPSFLDEFLGRVDGVDVHLVELAGD